MCVLRIVQILHSSQKKNLEFYMEVHNKCKKKTKSIGRQILEGGKFLTSGKLLN